jgi:hypothetical protein
VDKKVSSIVHGEVKSKLGIMVPSIMMALKIRIEGGQIGPNPMEKFLNSGDEDFSVEDILTRTTFPSDAHLARTCYIIAVNPSAPINATTSSNHNSCCNSSDNSYHSSRRSFYHSSYRCFCHCSCLSFYHSCYHSSTHSSNQSSSRNCQTSSNQNSYSRSHRSS